MSTINGLGSPKFASFSAMEVNLKTDILNRLPTSYLTVIYNTARTKNTYVGCSAYHLCSEISIQEVKLFSYHKIVARVV